MHDSTDFGGVSIVILVRAPALHFLDSLQSARSCSDDVVVVVDGDRRNADQLGLFPTPDGVSVFLRPLDGFAAQRNYGVQHAKRPWTFHLDSDEIITAGLAQELREWVGADQTRVYSVRLLTFVWGRPLKHLFAQEKCLRLHHRTQRWIGRVHERPGSASETTTRHLNGLVEHRTVDSLAQWLHKTGNYVQAESEGLVGWKRSRWHILWRPIYRFAKYYVLELGLLDGYPGLVASFLGFVYEVLLYTAVWESLPATSREESNCASR